MAWPNTLCGLLIILSNSSQSDSIMACALFRFNTIVPVCVHLYILSINYNAPTASGEVANRMYVYIP